MGKLLDAERTSGGECVESKINGGGAMSVPATSLPAIGSRLMLLGLNRDLPTVYKLEHE